MSQRLTKEKRQDIIRTLMNRAFNERRQLLENEGAALFEKLIKAAWGDYYTHIEAIPAQMLSMDGRVYVSVNHGGGHVWTIFSGHYPMPIPANLGTYWNQSDFETMPKDVQDACCAHKVKASALAEEEAVARQKLEDAIYGVSTRKKLYELWPELATVPAIEQLPEQGTKQLAVNREELNAVFGLPVTAGE